MSRTAQITLEGVGYTVHALNIGQLERVSQAFEAPRTTVAFAVLRIAMERAEPRPDLNNIEPTMDEISAAFTKVIELAGITVERKSNGATANPPGPVAPAP